MSQSVPLFVLGSSGHAREIAAYALLLDPQRTIWFVDDASDEEDCISVREYIRRTREGDGESVLGAGRCEARQRMLGEIRPPFATIVCPTGVLLGEVAPGCVVAPGAVIAPHARLEPHVMVNYNATVGHDTHIGALSVVGPGAAIGGWCRLEKAVYVGAGALIRERLTIGRDAIIGMGAVVTADVPSGLVAAGVPARLKSKSECAGGWLK